MADDPKYNWIYKALVKGPDDVSGALAYGLYKTDKIAYIESFAKEKGHQPDASELAEFHRMTNLPGALDAYRERADALLETFLDNMLTEQLAVLKSEMRLDVAINSVKTEVGGIKAALRVDEVIQAVKPKFMSGVWQNIVAGLVTTFITFGFVLGAWMYNEGPSKILSGAANRFLGTDAQAAGSASPPSSPKQAQTEGK